MHEHWYAVVMAGGAGTRFWPASRKLRPKQFLALGTRQDENLLQGTVRRLSNLFPPDRIYIATGQHLVQATRQALGSIPPDNLLAEPTPRNTAPCIAWANEVIRQRDSDAVVAVLSADHVATDEDAYVRSIHQAMQVASEGPITTLGIVPTRPETGYGYIQTGQPRGDGALDVERFVEKPDLPTAQKMLEQGTYLWNAGFFFFRVGAMRQAVAKHLPALLAGIDEIMEAADSPEAKQVLERVFPTLPSVSIDVGVMEKVTPLAVVPSHFGWSDVGSWQTAWELAEHDANDNARPEDAVLVDSHGNMVARWTSGTSNKTIALVGVENLVVVDTEDALLVMPRSRSQDVRKIVEELRKRGRDDVL